MKCIILAGGSGERLWPISRTLRPKYLINLSEEGTLLQNIFNIALSFVTAKNILTVTNIRQETDIKVQLKGLTKNPVVISEPMAKLYTSFVYSYFESMLPQTYYYFNCKIA